MGIDPRILGLEVRFNTCFVDTRRPADSLDTLKQKDDDQEGILFLVKDNYDLGVWFHQIVTFQTILFDHYKIP